ncbi:Crp/Fnr family transcriptional regulator [Mesorhizobium sp. VNQ89]|uniref:Crp/Fnr family transcriptional regulator n=1 Tax=Mesorhizobium quangtriensis TaxID=3157709 RepID=UPI0032B847DE
MKKQDAQEIMRSHGWLSRQPEPFRDDVLKRCSLRHFEAGETLYDYGDDASGVYGLVEGAIELDLANGHIGTIRTAGYWIGETAAFRGAPRMVSLVAIVPSYTLYLPLAEFQRLIENPEYCRYFALLIIEHIEEAISIIVDLMASDPLARVSGRLVTLGRAQSSGSKTLPVTQAELASMCGLARPTVNRVIKVLTKSGLLESHYGRLTIVDLAKLQKLARPDT